MTRARVEAVAADHAAAVRLLEQARRQFADAESPALSPESSYALAYQATLKALIARRWLSKESGRGASTA